MDAIGATFRRHFEYIEEANRLLHIAMRGLSAVKAMPAAVTALAQWDVANGREPDGESHKMREATEAATIAEQETERGFPTLHAHASVDLWSSTEACVDDLLCAWLGEFPEELKHDALAKVKIAFGEYLSLQVEDRVRYVLEEVKQSVRSALKPGIGRFEAVLDLVKLGGGVPDGTRRDLYELSLVRNVLVHRAGIVDRRFKAACDWRDDSVGARIIVSHADYSRYLSAVCDYLSEVLKRMAVRRKLVYPEYVVSSDA